MEKEERIPMTIRLESVLYVRVRDFAIQTNATHNALIESAIAFYLDHVQVVMKMPSRTQMQSAVDVIRDTRP